MLLRGNDDSRAGSPWVHKLQRGPQTPPRQQGGIRYPTSALASCQPKMTSCNRLSPGWTSSGRESHQPHDGKPSPGHAFSSPSGKQIKGAIHPAGGGTQTSSSRPIIWLGVPGQPRILILKGGCCRQHTCPCHLHPGNR